MAVVALLVTPLSGRADPTPGPVGQVICVVDEVVGTSLRPPCPTAQTADTSSTRSERAVDKELVPDLIVAKFVRGASERKVTALVTRLELTTVRRIPSLRLRALRVKPERRESTLAELERSPLVERAEQDRVVRLIDVMATQAFEDDWGPRRVGAPAAWDVTHGSQNVTVAVIDTGSDATHPDLRGSFVPGYDVIGNDADPADENGHGTAVAGIIGARARNGQGQAGLCSACSLMAVRVLGADGYGTTSTIANGIVRAVNAGARVLNLSLGSIGTTDTQTEAVNYALSRGVLVVAAAGNDGLEGALYPAAYPGVVSVAATDEGDRLYSWSNRGAGVRVAAPGCNTAPALHGGHAYFCGTSSASPMVSGIAALILSVSPQITVRQVKQSLEATAVPIPGIQFGRVDAARTMAAFAPRVTLFTASGRVEPNRPRNHQLVVGQGTIDAVVAATGPQRVTLTLLDKSGAKLATARGHGSARVKRLVTGGTYTLRVSAATRLKYALHAEYIRPKA